MTADTTESGGRKKTAADESTVESTGIADVRASMLNYQGGQSPTKIKIEEMSLGHVPLDVHWCGPHGEVGILARLTADEAEALAEQLEKTAAALREANSDA